MIASSSRGFFSESRTRVTLSGRSPVLWITKLPTKRKRPGSGSPTRVEVHHTSGVGVGQGVEERVSIPFGFWLKNSKF